MTMYVWDKGIGDSFSDLGMGLIIAAGLLVILTAVILFSFDRMSWFAAGLFVLGTAAIWTAAFLASTQTYEYHTAAGIPGYPDVITLMYRYSPTQRYLLYATMLLLPIIVARVLYAAYLTAGRRRLSLVPMHMKHGLDQLHHQHYDAAITQYTKALEIDPDVAEAYDRRGTAYYQKGDLDHALPDFNQALTLDPRSSDAFLHRALVHMARGFYDLAVVDFNMSLDIQPNVLDGLLNRGICRFKLADYAGAAADFRLILHLTNHSDYADPARQHLQQLGVPC
jgi:tetratricopeptide (TPR) repeat protein